MTQLHSEDISKLMAALSKAQGMIEGATKDSANPFFKSKYADLHSVWQSCRVALASNELAVTQSIVEMNEKNALVTMLAHSSGQWVKSIMPIPPNKGDAQSMGSAISYARRYALSALVGISQMDDDGEEAMKEVRKPTPKPMPTMPIEDICNEIALTIDLSDEHCESIDPYVRAVAGYAKEPMQNILKNWLANPDQFIANLEKWMAKQEKK